MLSERHSALIRVLTGNLFAINSFGGLVAGFIYWVMAGIGDPAGPDPITYKNNLMLTIGIIDIILLAIFIFSIVLAVIWSTRKIWSGFVILSISILHFLGIGYLQIYFGWHPDQLFLEIILLLPALLDFTVVALVSFILLKKPDNLSRLRSL